MASCVSHEPTLTTMRIGQHSPSNHLLDNMKSLRAGDVTLNMDSNVKLDTLCEAANVFSNQITDEEKTAHNLANKANIMSKVVPQKRAVTSNEGSEISAEPTTPKKRSTRNKSVKLELSDDDVTIAEPVTPPKKRISPKKTTSKSGSENGYKANVTTPSPKKSQSPTKYNADLDITVRNTPRQRQAPKNKVSEGTTIPESWDKASAADRMLYEEKKKGAKWDDIREKWAEMTGQETAASTLPNRYNRIAANFRTLEPGDDIVLIQAYRTVEDAFEREKWGRISNHMVSAGAADDYPVSFLQKKYKDFTDDMNAGKAPNLIAALQNGKKKAGGK